MLGLHPIPRRPLSFDVASLFAPQPFPRTRRPPGTRTSSGRVAPGSSSPERRIPHPHRAPRTLWPQTHRPVTHCIPCTGHVPPLWPDPWKFAPTYFLIFRRVHFFFMVPVVVFFFPWPSFWSAPHSSLTPKKISSSHVSPSQSMARKVLNPTPSLAIFHLQDAHDVFQWFSIRVTTECLISKATLEWRLSSAGL